MLKYFKNFFLQTEVLFIRLSLSEDFVSKNSTWSYLTGLTNYIIHQRKVGSVVTQSYNDYSDDEDDDANPNGLPTAAEISKEVYGLATVIKLLREKSLTKGVIEYLVQVR